MIALIVAKIQNETIAKYLFFCSEINICMSMYVCFLCNSEIEGRAGELLEKCDHKIDVKTMQAINTVSPVLQDRMTHII